ncbi:MAG: hypothetical protein K6G46_02745 [Prevotella sp.]|nr:hypothetical protein [Prevotella sp.]
MKRHITLLFTTLLLTACSDNNKYHDIIEQDHVQMREYKTQIQQLQEKITEIRDSVATLQAEIQMYHVDPYDLKTQAEEAYKNKDKDRMGEIIVELLTYHPENKTIISRIEFLYSKLTKQLQAEQAAEQRRLAAEQAAEQRRQAAEQRRLAADQKKQQYQQNK